MTGVETRPNPSKPIALLTALRAINTAGPPRAAPFATFCFVVLLAGRHEKRYGQSVEQHRARPIAQLDHLADEDAAAIASASPDRCRPADSGGR